MASWVSVLVPAAILATVVRTDAKLIGPYFALSQLVPGYEGLEAKWLYGEQTLRFALIRRVAYPVLLGFGLTLVGYSTSDVLAVMGVSAGLILWPIVFHGMPRGVSRRDWEVPVVYLLLVIAFIAAGAVGSYALDLMREIGDGSARQFVVESGVQGLFWFLLGTAATALFRPSIERLRAKTDDRKRGAAEMEHEGDPADLCGDELDDFEK